MLIEIVTEKCTETSVWRGGARWGVINVAIGCKKLGGGGKSGDK